MRLEFCQSTSPRIWKANTLNLKLEEIPPYQRRPDRPHKLLAVAQINGEMEDGKPKYRPLGTVNQPSAIDHQLKAGMTTNSATVIQLKPELQENQIKLLFTQAQAIAKDFYSNIPPSQRLSAAAAAWSVAASRQDEVESTSANTTTTQADNSQKKVSNFIFAAFPNEILSRLDELQFNHLKLTNISTDAKIQTALSNPHSLHEIEIKADVPQEGIQSQPSRSVFVKDSDGKYIKFGTLEPRTGKLPVGTKAQATILPGDTYTAKATLTEPGKPPIEFTVREIAKFSHAGQTFNGEQVTLTIANTQVPTDTVLIKQDGKVLGELDSDSVNELKKVNCLENNKILKLKLKSIGSTAEPGGFIIASSPKGNLLRINKINYYDFKGQDFNDVSHRNVTLELPPHKPKTAVFLDNKLLGVLHFNQDKSTLKQLGILKNAGSNFVSCTLQSNFSHSYLIVDSATVQYPSTWVKENVTNQNSQQLVVTEQEIAIQNSAPFLHKLKERATVLFSSHEDKMLGLAGLAVDNKKLTVVQQWLVSKGIEFDLVPKLEVPEESRKGLAILYLHTNTIVPQDLQALKVKFGFPLDANGSNSPYSQYLKSLPNRPGWQNQETKVKIDTASSSTHVAPQETVSTSNSSSASTSATNSIDAIASNATTATATAKPNSLSPEGSSNATTTTAKPNFLSPEGAPDATLDRLRQWYVAAKELNKPQVYLDSISFAANEFKQGRDLPTEAISAMQADIDVYKRQLNTQEKLNQLSDRNLIELHHDVTDYLKNPPTQPPGQMEQQLVQDEISLLVAKIDSLLKKQLLQVESVNSLQNKPFGSWTGQYKEAVADLEQTQTSLQRFSSKKEQKVYQLQQWVKQSADYQAWQNDPRTHQMNELSSVLDSPHIQARLKSIQQLQQQQTFERSHKHKRVVL